MPRKPKVYTVIGYVSDRETGEVKKISETKKTLDADYNVANIENHLYFSETELKKINKHAGERIAKNLSDSARQELWEVCGKDEST